MTVCPPKTPKSAVVKNGAKVITTADIRWGRCDIKTISLLANVLAKQQAIETGAREAILVRENGVVTEGAVSNAYIVTKSGVLMTHPANKHILAGVTRDVVLRLARKAGIKVAEKPYKLADLRAAREVFITSTSINVLPVTLIDGKKVGGGKVGPATQKLQVLYNLYVFKQTGKKL
jgi:D-alanine transaminase